jgi:hypothetical protein
MPSGASTFVTFKANHNEKKKVGCGKTSFGSIVSPGASAPKNSTLPLVGLTSLEL